MHYSREMITACLALIVYMIRSDGLLSKCDDPWIVAAVNTSAPNRNVFNYWRVNLSTWLQRNEILSRIFFSYSRLQSNRRWYKGRMSVRRVMSSKPVFMIRFSAQFNARCQPYIMLCVEHRSWSHESLGRPLFPSPACIYVCVCSYYISLFCAARFYYYTLLFMRL